MSYFGPYNIRFTLVDVDGIVLASPGDELDIHEPENFGGADFKGTRSFKWFAFNSEYLEKESLKLKFDNVKKGSISGFSLINSIINSEGFQGKIKLKAYRTPIGGLEKTKEWSIILKDYDEDDYSISVKVERIDFSDKLRTRFDEKINIESTKNLDDVNDTAASLFTIPLHSRPIHNRLESDNDTVETILEPVNTSTGDPHFSKVEIDFGYPQINELDGFTQPADITYERLPDEDIQSTLTPVFRADFDGTIELDTEVDFAWLIDSIGITTYSITLKYMLGIYQGGGLVQEIELDSRTASGGATNIHGTGQNFDSIQTIEIKRKQELFLYFTVSYSNGFASFSGTATIDRQNTYLSILYKSRSDVTLCEGLFLKDALVKLSQKAIGDESYNPIRSSVLDGCASLDFITTGNKIRGLSRDLILSLKDSMEFLRNRYACGMSIVRDGSNTYIDLEDIEDFFTNTNIINIDDSEIADIKRNPNPELLINALKVGYKKYANPDKEGSKDGFNTERGYLLPVTHSKKTLDLTVANVCTDGAEIERIKRLNLNDVESDQADESLFIIKCFIFNSSYPFDPGVYGDNYDVMFLDGSSVTDTIIIQGLVLHTLIAGDRLHIPSFPATYTIDAIELDYRNNRTLLTVPGVNFNTFAPFYFQNSGGTSKDIIMPQRRDNFNNTTGFTDINWEYNLHHSITNFLFAWYKYFGSALNKNDSSDVVKITEINNNIETAKRYIDDTCGYTGSTISENSNLALSVLRSINPTFLDIHQYEIECYLNYDDKYATLEAALFGEQGSKDYGLISFNYKGVAKEAWVVDIQHSKEEMKTILICWGKK